MHRHKKSLSSYAVSDFEPRSLKDKSQALNKYISSKVDFFNSENQRRLDLSKRKIMVDLGLLK